MDKEQGLFEDIVQRVTGLFQRSPAKVPPPDTDSSIEARKSSPDGMDIGGRGAFDWYSDETSTDGRRKAKYKEYERMDTEAVEIASALDIYADNATSGDRDTNETIEVLSDSELVVDILTEVKDRLGLDFDLWSIAREMVKYGDCFEEVVVYPDNEVHRLKHIAPEEMVVKEDKWGRLDPEYPYEQTDDMGDVKAKFAEWQIIHFKMDKDRDSKYGVNGSMLYPLRKVFKQLAMIEDSLIIARLTRAQQRFAYMIDVTGIEPGDATEEYLNRVKNGMRKKRTIDPHTGKMDLKYNPLSAEEDLFLAKREGGGSDVKVLQGASNLGELADVEYFSKKLFAGLKVPKAWMGFEGDTHARAVVTELDVQFAKTVRRVQQALIKGLRKLFDFVLITRGIDPTVNPYTLKLPVLSAIDELREWQMEVIKANVATTYKNNLGISSEWVYRNMLQLTDEEIEQIKATIEDENSIDNVRFAQKAEYDKEIAIIRSRQAAKDSTNDTDEDIELDAQVDGEAKATEREGLDQVENLSVNELRMMRYRMKEELDALAELVEWEYENKTGEKLVIDRQRNRNR